MNRASRIFAVIPAAGHSRRMGTPKLMLKIGEGTVIRRLLDQLKHPAIATRIVVVRRDDELLAKEVAAAGAAVIQPAADPPDMRTSVENALAYISRELQPVDTDGWLLVPGDHPILESSVLETLVQTWHTGSSDIVVPSYLGKRGHPTIFPWKLAPTVAQLPADVGLNVLLKNHAERIREVPVDRESVLFDLDTPEDFENLRGTLT